MNTSYCKITEKVTNKLNKWILLRRRTDTFFNTYWKGNKVVILDNLDYVKRINMVILHIIRQN